MVAQKWSRGNIVPQPTKVIVANQPGEARKANCRKLLIAGRLERGVRSH
jgi:hypothetical protein